MASENNLGGSVGLDVTAFKAGVMELTNQMKAIENSFRASAAVMGDWSSSTQGLSSRVSSLQDKLALQRKALDTLNSAYQKTVSEQGAGSKSAQSLAKQMFDMQGKIKGTEGQLKKYQSALQTTQKEEKESTSSSAKLGKAFQDFAKKSKESTSNVKSHFSDLKSSILGAVATIGAGLGFKSAIQGVYNLAESASDLVEAQNVVESTFKTSAKSIEAWTDTTAESAGIGKTAATQWSGFMGAMLKSNGITESTASTMSKSLVQLTGDMSSFYNVGTDEMWEKIRSGISGETEPLKQLGINMSEANLQAYAMSQGIDKSYSSMSQSEKTTLRYNYLLSVTKDAQGDFAKTSNDSMANQSRIFQMNIEDMKQTVGAAFLPMINDMYKSLNPLIKEIAPQLAQKAKDVASAIIAHKDEIAQTIKNTVQSVKDFFTFMNQNGGAIKGIVAGIGTAFVAWKVASTIGKAVTAIKKFEEAQKKATLAQAIFNAVSHANPIGLIVIAIGVLVATFAILWNKCGGFRNFWIGLWNGIKSAAQAFGAWFSGPFVQFFQSAGNGIKSFFTGLPGFFSNFWNTAKAGASTGANGIKNAFSGAFNGIKSVWNAAPNFFSGLWNGITGGVTSTVNAVRGAFNSTVGWVTNIFEKIKMQWMEQEVFADSTLNKVKSAVMSVVGPIISGARQVFAGVKTIFSGLTQLLKNVVLGPILLIIDTLKGVFTGNFTDLYNDFLKWGQKVHEAVKTIGQGLMQIFSGIWSGISGSVSAFWNLLSDGFTALWSTISTGISTAWNNITAFFAATWNKISNGIKTFWNSLPGFFSNLWNTIKTGIKTAWNAILQYFKQLWVNIGNGIKSAWTGFWTTIKNLCNTIKTGIINIWNSVLAWFRALPGTLRTIGANMFTSMRDGVTSTVGNVVSAVKTGIGAAIDWIKALPSEAIQWGKDLMNGIANGIKSAAGAVGDAVNGVAQNIRKFLHHTHPDEGPLADDYTWMPDMMDSFVQGINANKYKVVTAMRGLTADMSISPTVRPAYAGGYAAPQIAVAPTIDNASLTVAAKYLAAKMDKIANRDIVLYTDNMKLAESANRGNAQIGKRYHRVIPG